MEIILLLATAVVATALMNLFMYGMEYITGSPLSISGILGTMLTFETHRDGALSGSRRAQVVGIGSQYILGFAFTFLFWQLWHMGVGVPGISSVILLAILSGIAGIVLWKIFLGFHPYPPTIRIPLYQLSLFCAHFIFAATVCYFFSVFSKLA